MPSLTGSVLLELIGSIIVATLVYAVFTAKGYRKLRQGAASLALMVIYLGLILVNLHKTPDEIPVILFAGLLIIAAMSFGRSFGRKS
ncbi:hypothetical protein BH10PAT2_BH10PAT2_1550 [soil metagenome]